MKKKKVLLKNLDFVFVMPAVFEAFGIAILEALSCGKPVVAFNTGRIPEVVINGKTGFLIPPYSIKLMAQKIVMLLKDEKMRRLMGHRGREIVEKKFNWMLVTKRIVKVYNECFSI